MKVILPEMCADCSIRVSRSFVTLPLLESDLAKTRSGGLLATVLGYELRYEH